MTVDEIKELLKSRLNEKRFYHSLCVADEAKRLAAVFGGDQDKMYLAGLLHDITKNLSDEEQLKLFSEFGIILSMTEKASPKVWHAISGALYVENKLKIDDQDIISAIRYHTTGKAEMTLSQKIVYLADLTSCDRCYPDVEDIRRLADKSLDEAIFAVLKFTVNSLSSKGVPIHPDTLSAYNELAISLREKTQI